MTEQKPRFQSGIAVDFDRETGEVALRFDDKVSAIFLSPENALLIATGILNALHVLKKQPAEN